MNFIKVSLIDLEKYYIVGMRVLNVELDKMKELLKRSPESRVIENYLEQVTSQLEQDVPAKASRDREYTQLRKDLSSFNVTYDHQGVLSKMSKAGIHGEEALELIEKALDKFRGRTAEVSEIYNEAMKNVGPKQVIIRDGHGGTKGVAIMPEAASSRGEELKKGMARNQPDYVFHVKPTNRKK